MHSLESKRLLRALGTVLRETRLTLGMSQETLAEAAGLHPTYISRVESGRYNITVKNLKSISRALELKVHEVCKRADI